MWRKPPIAIIYKLYYYDSTLENSRFETLVSKKHAICHCCQYAELMPPVSKVFSNSLEFNNL